MCSQADNDAAESQAKCFTPETQSPNSLISVEKTFQEYLDHQPREDAVSSHSARHWTFGRKLWISLGAIASFFVITLGTSIYVASIPGIMSEFGVGSTLAISPITFYAMGFIIGPVCTSALSERFGRQYIYKTSLTLCFMATLVAGSARSFRTIAVCRAIAGLVGSPAVTVFVGVLNDLWKMPEDKEAVPLFLLYGLGGAIAPEIGPIVGESIVAGYGWRWSFWLTTILIGVCLLAMIFAPETFEPEIERKIAGSPRKDWFSALGPAFCRPVSLLLEDRTIIIPTAAVVTMSQTIIFVFYAAYPIILSRVYKFSPYEAGLAFLPLLLGTVLAIPIMLIVDRRKRSLPDPQPEDILPSAILAGILLPISLLWLAWTTRPAIHWTCPLLAGVLYGVGFALSQLVYPLYKNEIYGAELGASVMAIDVSMRYLVSCVSPLFTIQLIDRIGFAWTITACAMIASLLAPIPVGLYRFGAQWREKSRMLQDKLVRPTRVQVA